MELYELTALELAGPLQAGAVTQLLVEDADQHRFDLGGRFRKKIRRKY